MNSVSNLLFAFCEGPMDVAVLKKVLVGCFHYEVIDKSFFSNMNSVLKDMFQAILQEHAGGEHHLKTVHDFFLPQHLLQKGDHQIFVFNGGGSNLISNVEKLYLNHLHSAFHENTIDQLELFKVQYLFLFDADDKGLNSVQKKLCEGLGVLGGKGEHPQISFIGADWQPSISEQGLIQGHIGLFLLCDSPERGTLEDLLLPIAAKHSPERIKIAENCMDGMFQWNKKTVSGLADYKKAVITTAGQCEKPGTSLPVIIDQSPLFKREAGQAFAEAFRELVAFLKVFIGRDS